MMVVFWGVLQEKAPKAIANNMRKKELERGGGCYNLMGFL
jgi:hypothetical protein